MSVDPFDPSRFVKNNTCLPCCTTPTGACSCALLIPVFDVPYADYATAAAVVDDPLQVASCIVYSQDTFADSLTASFDGTSVVVSATFPSATSSFGDEWVSISAKSGATLSLAFTDAENGAMRIYDCNGTEVEFLGPSASPVISSALPADGVYYLAISLSSPPMTTDFTACSFTLTSSNTYAVNPVIALWDDSGTTRQLEACPKMLLPPLTEATGTWYADCATADAVLTDALQVSNCMGFLEDPIIPPDTFDFFGSTFTGFWSSPVPSFETCWASANFTSGGTVTFFASTDGGTPDVFADIYDYTGTLVESLGSGGGGDTQTSSPLPYTGRYIIRTYCVVPPPGASFMEAHIAVSFSSIGWTLNPITALYDLSLDCSGRLNCGDSCP